MIKRLLPYLVRTHLDGKLGRKYIHPTDEFEISLKLINIHYCYLYFTLTYVRTHLSVIEYKYREGCTIEDNWNYWRYLALTEYYYFFVLLYIM